MTDRIIRAIALALELLSRIGSRRTTTEQKQAIDEALQRKHARPTNTRR